MDRIAGKAPMMLAVLWTFQAVAFALVGLRLYARLVVVQTYGWDDHCFNGAVILLFVYNVLISVAATLGIGQLQTGPFTSDDSRALLLVNIAQSLIDAMAILVKVSIALFLLRIVASNRAHKIIIIVPAAIMSIIVAIALLCLWFSCTPISYSWDLSIPNGQCNGDEQFVVALLGGLSIILVEVLYASFPWYLVRKLQMPRREKILVGSCMSFGYLSALCSVYRLLALLDLAYSSNQNYFYTIVDLLIWHSADITTQLVSIGVTVCRPLYKDWLNNVVDQIESVTNHSSRSKSNPSGFSGAGAGFSVIALQTIGGSTANHKKAGRSAGADVEDGVVTVQRSWRVESNARSVVFPGDDESEEHILGNSGRGEADNRI
ncbi:hypothetical protein M406DRAFT_258120 [Cryphonectria parasitica EP155]|uniref:Rhodopsin domain-containing protein n=1 Tax=Cryphonectria parasitica (strain ATCC 38755 / EP155) TaxID=660469 RepID=A0A9P4XZG5_CRYP1|nr:uncharacterized protein M406DRAFT_258120 [Cryphonectria parasitica EP155]KAF3764184.1 hypothetical protein M406DRAFT_258120 [Cryphonectria parasitica EP155]